MAELVGLVERLLGRSEIAEPQPDLADLRIAGGSDARRPRREQLRSLGGGLLRGLELALVAHHLGAVDPADTRERRDCVLVAEELRALGPLERLVERRHFAARADRVAVEDDGVVGLERAAVRGRIHLVQEEPPLVDLAEVDQRDRAPLPAAQLEPQVAVFVADPLCSPAELPCGLVVVCLHRIETLLEREIAVCDPLGLVRQ